MSTPAARARDGLLEEVRAHVERHPGLTAFEVARGLGLSRGGSTGQSAVRRRLELLEADGAVSRREGARHEGDGRAAVRWEAAP